MKTRVVKIGNTAIGGGMPVSYTHLCYISKELSPTLDHGAEGDD